MFAFYKAVFSTALFNLGSVTHLIPFGLQLARYSTEGLLQLGPLGSTTFLPDTKCLIDDGRGRTPSLKKCDAVSRISQRLWDFTQVRRKRVNGFKSDDWTCACSLFFP